MSPSESPPSVSIPTTCDSQKELNCAPNGGIFCIPNSRKCDFREDCDGGLDEQTCGWLKIKYRRVEIIKTFEKTKLNSNLMKVNIFKFEYTKRMHFTQLENLALLRMEFAIGHHLVAGK